MRISTWKSGIVGAGLMAMLPLLTTGCSDAATVLGEEDGSIGADVADLDGSVDPSDTPGDPSTAPRRWTSRLPKTEARPMAARAR